MSIFAFDFDGVICDSSYETGLRAWEVLRTFKSNLPLQPPQHIMQRWHELRPILEKGWHSVILIHEAAFTTHQLEEVTQNWEAIQQDFMNRHRISADELHKLHHGQRQFWIKHHHQEWLEQHRFYPGILDKFHELRQKHRPIIITTKAREFTMDLLQYIQIELPEQDIFTYENKTPKEQTLKQLLQQEDAKDGIHFIEDRLLTLQRILALPELDAVQLYLAAWGYNSPQERQIARNTRIKVVHINDL